MSSVKPAPQAAAAPPKATLPHLAAAHGQVHLPLPKGPSFSGVLEAMRSKTGAASGKAEVTAGYPLVVTPRHDDADGRAKSDRHHHHRDDDDLDPAARQAAQLAPPLAVPAASEGARAHAAAQTHARVSMEDLLPALVKKIAWSGDAQRGTVRMELGAGELAGATLMVSSEGGRVRVNLQAPPGTDTAAWRDRLRARLEAKGLSIESLEVE